MSFLQPAVSRVLVGLLGLWLLSVSPAVLARPISYAGGYTLMSRSDTFKDSLYLHYSPSYRYSVGIEAVSDKLIASDYSHLRLTVLAARRNRRHSQGNLYLMAGISGNGSHYFHGLKADWETRRFFVGGGYKRTRSKVHYDEKYLQLGIAPYVGDYDQLHTWLNLKSRKSNIDDRWMTYPLLRLFKGNAMLELGYSDDADWDLHLMYQF